MSDDFTGLHLKTEYRTSIALTSKDFYTPILQIATKYDRAVGFFSSTSLVHIADGLLPFINNGGCIRLVASPILSVEDVEAIKKGYEQRKSIITNAIINKMYTPSDFKESERLNLLANLISDGRMDIRIALVINERHFGIYHEKMGVFYDPYGNKIAFSGSNNETYMGMDVNYESFDVFCSWKNAADARRADIKSEAFQNIWDGCDPKVEIYDLPEIKDSLLKKYMRKKVDYKLLDPNDFEEEDKGKCEKEIQISKVYGARVPKDIILHVFEDISTKFGVISEFEFDYMEVTKQIEQINHKLDGMLNVGELQKKYTFYEGQKKNLYREINTLNEEKGAIKTKQERCETNINELVLKDDNNRRLARFKAYATYMYRYLHTVYQEKEAEVREQLETTVNKIFKEIYNGGFSLKLDEKYNIQILVDDFESYTGDVETSTAQSISVIFAFIAGVIKMARQNSSDETSMLMTEAYPLVMDAPLSAFDKTRIKTVCDALPKVAEQVIIFIKDTDGEIAENNMGSRVGQRYLFDKKNEFETKLVRR